MLPTFNEHTPLRCKNHWKTYERVISVPILAHYILFRKPVDAETIGRLPFCFIHRYSGDKIQSEYQVESPLLYRTDSQYAMTRSMIGERACVAHQRPDIRTQCWTKGGCKEAYLRFRIYGTQTLKRITYAKFVIHLLTSLKNEESRHKAERPSVLCLLSWLERLTRLELATSTLARLRSTRWAKAAGYSFGTRVIIARLNRVVNTCALKR